MADHSYPARVKNFSKVPTETTRSMAELTTPETTGAWIVHHGRKLQSDVAGASEFPAIDGAAKGGLLLAGMAASDEAVLSADEVIAIAKTAHLNPKTELSFVLSQLKQRQLIDVGTKGSVSVLGVSSRKVLQETAMLYGQLSPTDEEQAAINVAESSSMMPRSLTEETRRVADEFRLSAADAADFMRRAREIGFVDCEGTGTDQILFNGNLFRRDSIVKSKLIIDSLGSAERSRATEVAALLTQFGCVDRDKIRTLLGDALFEKLLAAGFYDVNTVSNDAGEHVFVTAPSAFHKFVNPMVDDAFDLAKALVAALTYGIAKSHSSRGRIMLPSVLLSKLVSGMEIGPATAIGQDYRVLEVKRVIKLRHAGRGLYFMTLLKRDIGQIAQQVLTQGGAQQQVLGDLTSAAMSGYIGPETTRSRVRREQRAPSRKHTANILQTLREQGETW